MQDLKKKLFELQKDMKLSFDRVVPVTELVVNRWEKAKFCGFGRNVSIYDNAYVYGNVEVGEDTWIGPFTILDGSGGRLKIGKGCDVSAGVQIYTHDTVKKCVSNQSARAEYGNVEIEDYCYIGPMSVISRGVKIGAHSIICTHSFVNKSFPEYSIIGGIPAIKIGEVIISNNGKVQLRYYSKIEK